MAEFRIESSASVRTRTVHVAAGVSVTVRWARRRLRRSSSLAAELATYRTDAERLDLISALDRHPDEESAAIRGVLADQAYARPVRRAHAGLPG